MSVEELLLADTPDGLRRGLDLLDELEVVGVDVERADSERFYRRAALIQVGGQGRVLLVDPLALDDLGALQEALRGRTVVLHALDNDLGPLATAGLEPDRVEDTAIAAAMLGLPLGLETLLADLLGVELDADKARMQRADWERRPLSQEMIEYAAGDVADLPALWSLLETRLREAGREPWYREELAAALALPPAEERRDWRRVKGIGRLHPLPRARVQALWERREELARSTDTSASRIAPDRVLVELAQDPPSKVEELSRRGMRGASVRRFGRDLLTALHAARTDDGAPPREDRSPTKEERARGDRLRALRTARAEELGIDPGVLCPSRAVAGAVTATPHTEEELRSALGLLDWQWTQLRDLFTAEFDLDAEAPAA